MNRHEPPDVDDQTLEHLERLARLVIEPGERTDLRNDLVELLGFVDSLLEADVDGVAEYQPSHSQSATSTERPDLTAPSLPTEVALALAPEAQDDFFRVPRTVEEG